MAAKLLKGTEVAKEIRAELKKEDDERTSRSTVPRKARGRASRVR